jgi:tetratricopeptide (TPR) repeat protein
MTDQIDAKNHNLVPSVPSERHDLANIAAPNPLFARTVADLAKNGLKKGIEAVQKEDYGRAILECNTAISFFAQIERGSDYATAIYVRGVALSRNNEYDRAINDFDEIIELDLRYPTEHFLKVEALSFRGLAWKKKKHYDKTIRDYEAAIQLAPKSPDALRFYAKLLATCPEDSVRDGKRAIQLATIACKLTDWKSGWALDTLASACAEVGRFEEAERYQMRALEDPARCSETEEMRERAELYRQKKPYRCV